MATAIENLKAYFDGYLSTRQEVEVRFVLEKIDEYTLRERDTVTELNERNSVDERKKSCEHQWVLGYSDNKMKRMCCKCDFIEVVA